MPAETILISASAASVDLYSVILPNQVIQMAYRDSFFIVFVDAEYIQYYRFGTTLINGLA